MLRGDLGRQPQTVVVTMLSPQCCRHIVVATLLSPQCYPHKGTAGQMLVITDKQGARDHAIALLTYLLGAAPPQALVQRYLQWSQQLDAGSLQLPEPCLRFPWLIGLLEPLGGVGSAQQQCLQRCLIGALSIVEASPVGAKLLVEGNRRHPLLTWGRIFVMGLVELLALPVRVISTLLRLP